MVEYLVQISLWLNLDGGGLNFRLLRVELLDFDNSIRRFVKEIHYRHVFKRQFNLVLRIIPKLDRVLLQAREKRWCQVSGVLAKILVTLS